MKSLPWFRFYVDVLNNFKVQRLSGQAFKNWVNCLCLAAKGGGILPPLPEIAFALRMSESEAKAAIEELQAAGLLDQTEAGLMPHNWSEHQYQSDTSTPRTKKHRERKRSGNVSGNVSGTFRERPGNVSGNVPGTFQGTFQERSGNVSGNGQGTAPDTDTDTEQIQNRDRTEQRQNRIASTANDARESSVPLVDKFNQLVDSYPNAVGVHRASQVWSDYCREGTITAENVHEVFAGLERWKRSDQWVRDGGRYIPSLDKWLRGKLWRDRPALSADALAEQQQPEYWVPPWRTPDGRIKPEYQKQNDDWREEDCPEVLKRLKRTGDRK
jgi:hypothetical protein